MLPEILDNDEDEQRAAWPGRVGGSQGGHTFKGLLN